MKAKSPWTRVLWIMGGPGALFFGMRFHEHLTRTGDLWFAVDRILMPLTIFGLLMIIVALRVQIRELKAQNLSAGSKENDC
ncbi:MAG: hypothetical protein FJ405_14230 [Verrucomicrobia bacterium]|nr:hypothetical protein [Verrucomicrobiota bacterium]